VDCGARGAVTSFEACFQGVSAWAFELRGAKILNIREYMDSLQSAKFST